MRRHVWIQAPLRLSIDGVDVPILEWSLGGVAVEPAPDALSSPGNRVPMRIDLPFEGFDVGFDAIGEVENWSAATKRSEIGFRDLAPRERELLSHFIDHLMQGTDTPVATTMRWVVAPTDRTAPQESGRATPDRTTPARATPDRATPDRARRSLWRPVRTATMTLVYGAAGLAALAYLGTVLYSNAYWLEAQSSMITAPVEQLVTLGDGAATWATFKPGDRVRAGDVILTIADNVLEREIDHSALAVQASEAKLAYLARRFESEKKRLGAFASLSNLKSAKTDAEIEGLNAKLVAAKRELRQLPAAAAGALAQVRQRIVGLQQAISLRQLERSGLSFLAKQNDGDIEFVGPTYVGEIDTIAAQIELAESEIEIAKQRHASYLRERDRMAVRAPFDGVLRELPHATSANLRKGDIAAVVEGAEGRRVTAFVRPDQAARIALGAAAFIKVPATRQTFQATVSAIEPGRGADLRGRGATVSGAGHAGNPGGMISITLALDGPVRPNDVDVYHDGLPAVTMIGLASNPSKPVDVAASTSVSPATPRTTLDVIRGWFGVAPRLSALRTPAPQASMRLRTGG